MPLPINSPFADVAAQSSTLSVATIPLPAVAVAPASGYIVEGVASVAGAFTGTIDVAVSINGGPDIFGGNFNLPAQAAAAPGVVQPLPLVGASSVFVNQGDNITFTPSAFMDSGK